MGGGTSFYDDFYKHAEPYLIEVGNNCQITEGVKVFTHGGAHVARYKDASFDIFGKVKIGDWCYIGNNALIMPGVTIGNHVLIAAGSVVTKSIPNGVVVAGNPAKFVCTTDQYIERNGKYNVRTKGLTSRNKRNRLLNLSDDRFVKKNFLITDE